jgi:hypothetical protein
MSEGSVWKKFEQKRGRLPPRNGCAMKEYDLSDRKLKIGVVLALVIIGWLCLKGESTSHVQTTPGNLPSGAQNDVSARTRALS